MSTTIKTENLYCVYDPHGRPVLHTMDWMRRGSISLLASCNNMWEKYYLKRGYTCRPVRVTIEELPKGEK